MEPHEYEKMAEVEDTMWWYAALHHNLLGVIERFLPASATRLLDAGCGTGGLLRVLGNATAGCKLVGLDAWQPACRFAAGRSGRPVVQGVLQHLPFLDGSLDCLLSADVLCHESVDPSLALGDMRRCLSTDGLLVLNLPAYQWMMSYHDERVQTVRRFTRSGLARLLSRTGFEPLYLTYWNTLLFPIMAMQRLLQPTGHGESDVHPYPPVQERFFRSVLGCERALLRTGLRLPFGGSVLAVARRRDG